VTAVVTIVADRTAHLVELVEGLRRQSLAPSELVVVVMGGEDPRPALPAASFPIHTHACEPSPTGMLPLARARNLGVGRARDEHVVLLDVDCIPGRELVASYDQALRDHDGLLMGVVRYLDPGATTGGWSEADLAARSREHPARPHPTGREPVARDHYERFWSLSFAVRRTTYRERLGGFDEELDGYGGEDTDLAFTARARGVPLWWVPAAVAYHQHHATYAPPLPHLESIVANAIRFRAKWGGWPMDGWLRAFAERGLVRWDPDGDELSVLREPTTAEIEAARKEHVVPAG
jgi:GT2 family glycosyltransferase